MKHFCTFGNKPNYIRALIRIYHQAKQSEYFDTVSIYDQTNTPRIQDHSDFIKTNPRGYGHWIWKPLVILDCMKKAKPNDIIIYADSGCSIYNTPKARELFAFYMNIVENAPHRISFEIPYIEEHWTKGDLLDLFKIRGTRHASSRQLMAGIQIMKNTPENKAFMEEWLSVMSDYHNIDDSPSISPNHPLFEEHRHDQSVHSILKKLRGTICVKAPGKTTHYPISITRLRNS